MIPIRYSWSKKHLPDLEDRFLSKGFEVESKEDIILTWRGALERIAHPRLNIYADNFAAECSPYRVRIFPGPTFTFKDETLVNLCVSEYKIPWPLGDYIFCSCVAVIVETCIAGGLALMKFPP